MEETQTRKMQGSNLILLFCQKKNLFLPLFILKSEILDTWLYSLIKKVWDT
jgi:uncharacterized protein YlaN (UPF0358 family)